MPKKVSYSIRMNDGTMKPVDGMELRPGLNYHKDEATKLFFLDHAKSGCFIATSERLKDLKELIQEPEFFDQPMSIRKLREAKRRWYNRLNP